MKDQQAAAGAGTSPSPAPSSAISALASAAVGPPGSNAEPQPHAAASSPGPCPPDTAELGRATWTFLHSVAAHYPQHPTPRQQELMSAMMEGLAEFYPCEICAEHLREQVNASPPRVGSALDLNVWLCGLHNEVNEMLGKPTFDCARVAERWREGPPDGSCD